MATSAATLTTIIATLSTKYDLDQGEITLLLSGKGLLPKKMLVPVKVPKAATKWASKAAKELAAEHDVSVDELKGTGNEGKITVKDVKSLLEAPNKQVNASHPALKYARDNKLDIGRIATGSGNEGKILLKDVQELKDPDPPADSDDEGPVMSPPAAKYAKQNDLDDDDLAGIDGSGPDGKILKSDLVALVAELKAK